MKKKNIAYIDKIDLPIEVKDGIKSRSSTLGATLRTITEEDLIQEGLTLVFNILKDKPEAPIPYIMKAINNHYADILKKEVRTKNLALQSFDVDGTEKELDAMSYRAFQRGKKQENIARPEQILSGINDGLTKTVISLKEKGYSFKEIAEYFSKHTSTIRRMLRKHAHKA